jgi:hypothetical protein
MGRDHGATCECLRDTLFGVRDAIQEKGNLFG